MNETLNAIKNRRSIRKFKSEQISDGDIQKILEAGIYAPSAGNRQKWHFTVIQNKSILNRIARMMKENMIKSGMNMPPTMAGATDFNLLYNPPTLILITGEEKGQFTYFDCGAATENMALAAESLNIGSCIIGLTAFAFDSESGKELYKELGVPEGYTHICSLSLGYKDVSPITPPRNMNVVNYVK
jgi:nitroreductase